MKILTKLLVAMLAITSLIPVKLGMLCLFDQQGAAEFFDVKSVSPGIEKIFFVLGGFVLATLVIPVLSIIWLIKRKNEGFVLAYLTGFISLARGMLMLINFNSNKIDGTRITVTPIIIGFVILLLTFVAGKQEGKK
ncbi:MAG: hypothetical protein QM737_19005 [Ferruginibacter sp.]